VSVDVVDRVAAPLITGFVATPASIAAGQSTTLNATVTDAASLTLDGAPIAGLPVTVSPSADHVYTLVATGLGGSATATAAVAVAAPVDTTVHIVPVNISAAGQRFVNFFSHYDRGQGAYDRKRYHVCFTAKAFTIAFATSSVGQPFLYPQYRMLVDGVERATYNRVGSEDHAQFVGSFVDEADAPHLFEIVAYDANGARVPAWQPSVVPAGTMMPGESQIPFWMWTDFGGTAKDHPMVVFQAGSYQWTHPGFANYSDIRRPVPAYAWALVPKTVCVDQPMPLTLPTPVPFNTVLTSSQIRRINRLPQGSEDEPQLWRAVVTKRGITVTEDIQGYFPQDWQMDLPRILLLDGPRNVNSVAMVSGIHMGRNFKVYVLTPWDVSVVDPSGYKKTLYGLHHTKPTYWEDCPTTNTEMVGDWSAIPVARQMMGEPWYLALDTRSTALDPLANPIAGEQPHVAPGVAFYTPSKLGVILRAQFAPNDPNRGDITKPAIPPVLTEHITGLLDPWGLDEYGVGSGKLVVGERGAHRISVWDIDSKTRDSVLLENPNGARFGAVDANRTFAYAAGQSYSTARADPIVAPEGLKYVPAGVMGADAYVVWGSLAQGEVRRLNLSSGQVEVCCRPYVSYGVQSRYLYVAVVTDDSFFPNGSILTTTYSNAYRGAPELWVPGAGGGGGLTHGTAHVDWRGFAYDVIQGAGATDATVYAMACGVRAGLLVCGSSMFGLDAYIKKSATDPVIDAAKASRGATKYRAARHPMLHGTFAHPHTSLPPPLGEDPEQDYFMGLSS
jgi:hypothetical protein